MSKHSGHDEIKPLRDRQTVQKTSTFRRVAPQVTNRKTKNCSDKPSFRG